MTLELEDTIVGRVEFQFNGLRCVKGAIEEPVQCPAPVFYKARFCPQNDGIVRIEGVAGFDAEYERAPFTWSWNPALNQLVIADWTREQMVPHDVFDQYKTYRRVPIITTPKGCGYKLLFDGAAFCFQCSTPRTGCAYNWKQTVRIFSIPSSANYNHTLWVWL